MPSTRRRPAAPEIRPARREDLPALAGLGAKLAREHHAMDAARFFLPEEPLEAGYAWWLGKERANRRAAVLAAIAPSAESPEPGRSGRGGRGRAALAPAERIVGYAYGRIEPRDWNTLRDACGVAVDLWVEPAARGAGLGARLVEALVAALVQRGADRVVLNVASRNPRAQRLFRRLGFRPTMLEMARECTPAVAPERGRAARHRAAAEGAGTAPQQGRPARARGRTLGA
jgi:ribosomal protein S18 acetylase RimI-like enzyme